MTNVDSAALDIASQLKDREVRHLLDKRELIQRELASIGYSQPLAGYRDASADRRASVLEAQAENEAAIERLSELTGDELVSEFQPRFTT